jgi:hypothetical protein
MPSTSLTMTLAMASRVARRNSSLKRLKKFGNDVLLVDFLMGGSDGRTRMLSEGTGAF